MKEEGDMIVYKGKYAYYVCQHCHGFVSGGDAWYVEGVGQLHFNCIPGVFGYGE